MALSFLAHADLPLTIDDLLADKNRFRLDTDVSYYNHHKSSSTTQADLSFAFGDVENLQAIAITDKEMKETEGAAIHPAVFIYGVRYGIPAMYAGARWLNANSHNVQIWQHRTRNLWNKR